MPSVLGKLGVTFLPPSKTYRPSPFKYNIPLPEQTRKQPSLYNTTQEEQPDFMSEYDKLVGGRPNRLAYQQAIEEGAPEIHRGKWAKLGAMLAAGGAGLGGTPAPQAAKLGISAYQEPQSRSDEKYKQRVTGLGNLAQFEDSDIQDKTKALEFKYNDYYKRKQDQREDKDLQIRQDANARAAGESEESILDSRQKREFAKWIEYQDSKDGNTYLRNRLSGERMLVGKTSDTSSEKLNDARDALKMKLWTELPYQIAQEDREQKNKMAQIAGTGANQLAVQKEKNVATAAKMAAGLTKGGMKPGDRYAQARLELSAAILNNPDTFAQFDIMTTDELGMPMVQPDSMSDAFSPGKAEAKAEARKILGEIMDRAAKGGSNVGGGNVPAATTPGSTGGNTESPNAATPPPSNVDANTITFVDPNGEEMTIPANDPRVPAMSADKNLRIKSGGASAVNTPAPANVAAPNIPAPNAPTVTQPRVGGVTSAEDKTRAAIRSGVYGEDRERADAAQVRDYETKLADPNFPNQLKGQVRRRLDTLKGTIAARGGTVPIPTSNLNMGKFSMPPGGFTDVINQPHLPNLTPSMDLPENLGFNPNEEPPIPPEVPFVKPIQASLDERMPSSGMSPGAGTINWPSNRNNFGANINPAVPPPEPNVIPRTNAAMNIAGSMPQTVPTMPVDIGNQELPFGNMPSRPSMGLDMNVNAPNTGPVPTIPPRLNPALDTGNMIPPVMPPPNTNIPTGGRVPNVNPIQLGGPEEPLSPEAAAMRLQPGGKSPFNMAPENPIKIGGPFKGKLPEPVKEPVSEVTEKKFKSIYDDVRDEVQRKLGVDIKVTRGKVTAAQQAAVKAKADKEGVWRTDADGYLKISPHQTGKAADIVFVDKYNKPVPGILDSKGRPTKKGEELYKKFGAIAKDHGLTWGGDYKERDWGHIQLGEGLEKGPQ